MLATVTGGIYLREGAVINAPMLTTTKVK
jgi:hypothetical protein